MPQPLEPIRVERATPASRAFAVGIIPGLVALAALPWWSDAGNMRLVAEMAYYLALAQLWNLLAGYAGLVSVGQQVYVGLGGYAFFYTTRALDLNVYLALPLAALFACVMAVPISFAVFRLRGAYFAIGTWVVAEVYRLVFAQVKPLGGGTGTSLTPSVTASVPGIEWIKTLLDVRTPAARDIVSYWAALALLAGTLAVIYWLLRSRRGLALGAIRDQEAAAAGLGVDIYRVKLAVYVASAAMTGMIGALIYLQKARISPDAAFSVLDWTAYVIFIVVIGGIGTMEGPVVGVIVFHLLQHYLADFGAWYLILLGSLGVAVMLLAPRGIWGLISERYDVTLFPIRRRLVIEGGGDEASRTKAVRD